jgi:hypothetical protein
MKFYGYANKKLDHGLLEMQEVTVSAKPEDLRAMASFLNACADQLSSEESVTFEHEHLSDNVDSISSSAPQFVVVNPNM